MWRFIMKINDAIKDSNETLTRLTDSLSHYHFV